jgi:hypothetical protein
MRKYYAEMSQQDFSLHIQALFSHLGVSLLHGWGQEISPTLRELHGMRAVAGLLPMTNAECIEHGLWSVGLIGPDNGYANGIRR